MQHILVSSLNSSASGAVKPFGYFFVVSDAHFPWPPFLELKSVTGYSV